MAKEFEKFDAQWKAMKPTVTRGGEKPTRVKTGNTNKAFSDREMSVNHVEDMMVKARRAGVTGTTVADFMKNRDYADAAALHKKTFLALEACVTDLVAHRADVEKTLKDIGPLTAAIAKDLKTRDTKSESRPKIEALQKLVEATQVDLQKAAAVVTKFNWTRVMEVTKPEGKPDAVLARLVRSAPEPLADAYDDNMLPQALVDRNRKKARNQAEILGREILAICADATAKVATDPAAAKTTLKGATDKFTALRKVRDDFTAAYAYSNKQPQDFQQTKDYAAITAVKDVIDKIFARVDSTLRDTVAKVRTA